MGLKLNQEQADHAYDFAVIMAHLRTRLWGKTITKQEAHELHSIVKRATVMFPSGLKAKVTPVTPEHGIAVYDPESGKLVYKKAPKPTFQYYEWQPIKKPRGSA